MVKLSKEEKKARKEAKKLEKLRLEKEAKKQRKRDELLREMAAQAVRREELDKNWRQMMLKIKEPVFRQDIEVMWHTFERVYDKKDHLINHTVMLMNFADEQLQRTVSCFCDAIDTMINKFLEDLDIMAKIYDEKFSKLLKQAQDNYSTDMRDHNAAETHLQLLIYHGHMTADNHAWTVRGENLVKQDEETSKYFYIRQDLTSTLENNYIAMWDEYKAVLRAYVVNTAENQKNVRKLRRKENLMADIIASQGKRISNNDSLLRRLRYELAAYETGTKQADFRDRRNRHREACFQLKKKLNDSIKTDVKQLAILVQSSDDALESLEAAYKKGEKILRMAALCRKFETRREKVMPYGSTMPHSPTQAKSNVRKQPSNDSLVVNAISSTCGVTRLWQRISRAELTKRALFREKMLLEHENAMMMRTLEERGNDPATFDNFKCICGPETKKTSIDHPVAIDGTLEIRKIIHH